MFSFRQTFDTRHWLIWSSVILVLHFVLGICLVMLLNGSAVNHIITPVSQYVGMFGLLWPEQPVNALNFIATKSLLTMAHTDSRSGLNLWTVEYSTYTVLGYVCLSLLLGWVVTRVHQKAMNVSTGRFTLLLMGVMLSAVSISYMSVIDHCTTANWVGFVTLYGLGFNEFQLYPYYQYLCAITGLLGLLGGFLWRTPSKRSEFITAM